VEGTRERERETEERFRQASDRGESESLHFTEPSKGTLTNIQWPKATSGVFLFNRWMKFRRPNGRLMIHFGPLTIFYLHLILFVIANYKRT